MACKPVERLTFFEIFKAHCSESDLGPISLNWFEELSAEAPPYEPKLLGELDGPLGCLDQTSFKTPGAKPSTYSQLVSTPPIFKEQILPPYSSPGKEVDQKKIEASRENLTSPSITRRKIIDQENEILATPPGTCHNFLATSPAILRNTYRTPQRNNIPGPYGSLFCTPKLLEVRTPKRISESLGAEVDPDMSWSSSLATPPTLGATVIIARENDSISGAKQQDGRADILSHNFFSNRDKCPGTSDASMLPVPETVELNAEDDIKDFESEMLNSLFGKMDSFEDTFSMPVKSSGTLLLPHALDTVEKCEITTDTAQGEGDVPSEQPNRRKIVISQEVETTRLTEKSHFIELKDSLLQNTDGDTGDGKDGCLIGYKELESLRIAGDRQDCRTCKSFENEKPVREMQSSSSQWSQLNSSDLDVTHLEMSVCSSPPSDLCRKKNLEEKTVLMTKDDAMETSLLNTSDLIKTQKLLSVNLSEKCYEVKASENNPTSEITPIKSVSLSVQDPKLVKGCAAEKVSKMSFLNCNSLLIESTNVTEYSVVYNGSFSKHLKATSKSVIADVLSHPLVCSATSPNNGNDLHLINNESTLTESGLKSSLNMLSSLRKRSKRFIYTINNTLLYQEEEIEKEVTSESPIHPVLPHSESDSYEFQGCHVASVDEQGCLLLAERKCLQSNIKENKFGICTLKMDIMGNSSGNSFSDRLKQQDLRDLRENAREDQPATSLKTLDISNTWKEDITNSLNSEITSNIKRKVLASACLMARKHSELFPKGCSSEKGKKDKYMGANVNDGGSVPWSLKEELAWSLPKNSEHLIDTHHGTTSVTDNSFNNTLSQINIGMNGVSSDCCNEVSTDKRLATDQWSVASCREALGPLGVNCSENYSTGLKQEEETDVAASSEVRANNGKPKSAENSESPQAADFRNVAVEMAKESIDCIDDSSSNKVICEEGKQVAPMYSSKKPIADLNYKGKSSGSLNAHSLNLSFGGFQTASNKQIKFSEVNIAKGRMLFKDIENECFEACSMERVSNFSNQDKKESMFSSDSESNLASSVSDSLDSQTNFLRPRHTQFTPHKIGLCKSFPRSPQSLQETNQTLTASQEAEIAELSSILEETGSQFEFTQFRKQSNMIQSHAFQQFGTVGTCGRKNVENNSEKRKYAEFCSTLKTKNQVKTEKYCMKQEDTNEDSDVVEYKKENAVVFHKNDKKVTFANLNRNESRISNESFPVAKGASFSHFVGFSSAGGKKINISKAALNRSAELFRDLDDDNYLFKSSKTSTRCHHLNSHMSSNCNFVRCLEKEKEGKMVCVSDFKSTDTFSHSGSVSHHAQKKDEENISTLFKENEENQTKRSIKYNENASFSSTNTIISSVSFIKNCNQNHKTSNQFLNQGGHQIEGSLKEDSLDVTCVGDAITGAEEQSVNIVDEIKNLSRNQKGEDRKGSECLSPKCRSPSGGDKSISVAECLNHSQHLINVQRAERDVNVLDNSHKLKANCKNMEEDATHDKILLENESRIKVGSYCHQIPVDQEVNVEKNEVDGSYLTEFHTASGKKITIADGLLARAEQFFAENVDVRKEHNDYFENPIKKRKCGKNCVKYWDLRVESTVQCDPDKLNKKLVPEEPGNQFKQAVESSPIKQAVLLDTVKVDTSFKLGERSLLTSYTCEKADVRPGKSELELLPGQERDALCRTCLSEDEKLFVEREMEYSPKKRDDSENMRDSPVRSAASLNLMEVSNDFEDNSVPGVTKDTLFAEDRNNISDQSLLLTSKSNHSHLSCDSTEFDLEHLNELCADPDGFMNTTVDACQNQSLVGLPEDETNLARLKETALSVENQKGDLKQIVFSTAKAKAVPVSESTLARVREMIQDNYSESVKYESNLRTSQTKITGNTSAIIHAECPNSFKFLNAAGSKEINSSTSHFIKVHASASESYHQDINISADAKPVSNSQMQCFEHNSKLLGHLPIPGNQLKESDSSTSSRGFFSTASGKPVQLSEESLRKARQLFSEMEGNQSSHVQEALLVEEGVEKSEMHTEVVPRKMQIMLPREEISSTELISSPAFGFSTASGKQVKVSKNAYQKAKAILEERDGFLSSGLCITDQLSSIKENDQHVESVTDKVISESKIDKSSNEDFVESIGLEEMKSFPGTHHVEMPEYVAHSKKNKQLTYKSNFQQEETRAFEKGQLNLGMKMESEAVSCIVTAKAERNINLLQTPNSYLEMEAIESARAFMEDDLSSSGAQINAAQSFSGRLDKNIQNKTFGKRHFEEENSLGEPPIKRQLLLEFNKTQNSPRSLKASKSTPDGIFKDRRKFIYHVPLKPVTCQPFGATEERQKVKNPTLTLPDQDFKGFKSKPAIFQHCAIRQSSNGTLGVSTPCKASTKESEETRRLYKSGKTAKTFIPPFKTKLTFSTGEQCSSKRCDSPISKGMTEEMELNQITTEPSIAEPQDHQFCIQHEADTDLENGNLDLVKMMTNLHCARDLQEMRIKKKYRQHITSQPGSLYVIKTSARNRISLKTAVEEKSPSFYSAEELYTYGVSKQCIQVNSTNAESFQFLIKDFFSKEYILAGNGMQLADGGWLIPTDEGQAGKKEFYRALCDTPGVDPKLITEAWVYNHYRWIVWKLAAMEVSFPHEFANRCLTPERVLLQLKYRYDLEVDKSKRSAIKKIMERDDAAGKTLVLCISKIVSLNTVVSPSGSNKNVESKKAAAIIEVTDGWYGIRALLDPPLKAFLRRGRLTVGQKIIVHGAELVGSQNGCTPLEAPDSLMLKISANSTRCARWHAKLGFHSDPRPFPLPLSSLYSEGGAVGCIDVVVQRTYPIQWMEKTSAGSYVFRNSRAEEREAAKHAEGQQKKLEALFAKIQAEYEKHEERTSRTLRSRIVTRQQIRNLQDGAELYEAIHNASDPDYMEGYLSEDQLKALNAYRQLMSDKKQTQIQEEFKKALESAAQEENGCSKRDVSTVWKLCVVDYRKQEKHKGVLLSIWRPLLDVYSLLKEGSRYRIYHLSTSQSKARSDSTKIQLSATKKTQYLQLSVSQEMLAQVFFPRQALNFTSLSDPSFQPPCAEVDLVGVVISISRTGFATTVYLSDESYNLVAVKIWTDLRHFAIEDIVVRCAFISASNLQWQSEFRSEIPMLLAGDLSVFSSSPKESYLLEKVNGLRSTIENVASFCSDAESKLMNLLQRTLFLTPSLTKRCGLECPSPFCNSGLYAEEKSLISSKTKIKHPSPLSTSTPNMKFVTRGSAKTPSPATINDDHHPKNSKKRKAMDFLSCIPTPPPLTPMYSVISPSLKKAFQPPRSLGLQHSNSSKETNQNIGHVTPCRKLREIVHLPENDLVADEELAMINTQALMNNLPEEKKVEYVNENSNAIATNLSDNLIPKGNSRSTRQANNLSKSSSEVAEALQKDTEEPDDLLPAHRMLQR